MTTQDTIRLLKLDSQLLELDTQIEAARTRECVEEIKFFRSSKNLIAQHERLTKMRSRLMRSVNDKTTRKQTYDMILQQRKDAERMAQKDLDGAIQDLASLTSNAIVKDEMTSPAFHEEFLIRKALVRSKRIILANKTKAVENWLDKSELTLPVKRSNEMRSSYGQFKEKLKERITASDVHKAESFELSITPDSIAPAQVKQQTPEDILGSNPNWNLCPAVNSASLELITQPTKQGESNE